MHLHTTNNKTMTWFWICVRKGRKIVGKGENADTSIVHNVFNSSYFFMKPFENIVGKEENAGNQHFFLFP